MINAEAQRRGGLHLRAIVLGISNYDYNSFPLRIKNATEK
jgi:hypothetical protein